MLRRSAIAAVRASRPVRVLIALAVPAACLAVALLAVWFLERGEVGWEAPDPATLQTYFDQYVALVGVGDEAALSAFLGNPNQPQDAGDRIAAHGHFTRRALSVKWAESEVSPDVYHVVVSGFTDRGRRFIYRDYIAWSGPDDAVPYWHWSMPPLSPIDQRMVGSWRATSADEASTLRIQRISEENDNAFYRVRWEGLASSPQDFFPSPENDSGVLYVSRLEAPADSLRYIFATDSVWFTDAVTGRRTTFERVD